jgi:hypothetical protein
VVQQERDRRVATLAPFPREGDQESAGHSEVHHQSTAVVEAQNDVLAPSLYPIEPSPLEERAETATIGSQQVLVVNVDLPDAPARHIGAESPDDRLGLR